ncbi:MAG: hypothetical protein GY854_09055 [Deltaproteobacteria bacterium]|nr:hypothetical protein [Deltaproteobacteria bacterium]
MSDEYLRLAVFIAAVLAVAGTSRADDLAYVSDKELTEEIENRNADISRARSRMTSLASEEIRAREELRHANINSEHTETLVAARAKLLYRLCRNGGSLRYLLGSTSATQLVKRLDILRRLVRDGLLSQRQAGFRLADAQNKLEEIRQSLRDTSALLTTLEEAQGELVAEQKRRAGKQFRVAIR